MKFGLIANLRREGGEEAIQTFKDWAAQHECDLILSDELKGAVPDDHRFLPRQALVGKVDFLVSMGGDGTILAAARSVGALGTPLVGINLGSLGFLTQQTPKQLVRALDAILCGDFNIEERMMLKVAIEGRDPLPAPFALNDIVLDNGPVSRVLDINLYINGEKVVSYVADGLVISTPTGSTAYNLAVGGPIVFPGMDAMIAAAISPFSLTTRPMILPGEATISLSVSTQDRMAMLTLDGQVGVELRSDEKVVISRADFRSKFVVFPENSYFKTLRSKLNWGVPPNF